MSCPNGLYGCYTCCYKFKVVDKNNWDLNYCPKCGADTLVCLVEHFDKIKECEGE